MGANAQTSVPKFTAGDVLTAANQNLSAGTGVPVFADTTARDAAFGGAGEKVLAEGQLCYLENLNIVQYYDGAAWATVGPSTSAVVQVKSAAKTDTFTTTSTTFTDVTGLSIAITPTSASNKVLVIAQVSIGGPGASTEFGNWRLSGGNSTNYVGDAASTRSRAIFGGWASSTSIGSMLWGLSMVYLDSPATTSATTYKVQGQSTSVVGGAIYVNRSFTDSDNAVHVRGASSITVMEVTP